MMAESGRKVPRVDESQALSTRLSLGDLPRGLTRIKQMDKQDDQQRCLWLAVDALIARAVYLALLRRMGVILFLGARVR